MLDKKNQSREQSMSALQRRIKVGSSTAETMIDNRPQAVAQRRLQEVAWQGKPPMQMTVPPGDVSSIASVQLKATMEKVEWNKEVLNKRKLKKTELKSAKDAEDQGIKTPGYTYAWTSGDHIVTGEPSFKKNLGQIIKGSENKALIHQSNGDDAHVEPGLIARSLGEMHDTWDDANKAVDQRNADNKSNADFVIYSEREPCGRCILDDNLGHPRYSPEGRVDTVLWATKEYEDGVAEAHRNFVRKSNVDKEVQVVRFNVGAALLVTSKPLTKKPPLPTNSVTIPSSAGESVRIGSFRMWGPRKNIQVDAAAATSSSPGNDVVSTSTKFPSEETSLHAGDTLAKEAGHEAREGDETYGDTDGQEEWDELLSAARDVSAKRERSEGAKKDSSEKKLSLNSEEELSLSSDEELFPNAKRPKRV
ncbi:hypothetical protein ACIPEN_05735 [Herbaspirillum chlorophenolicum]|uniref:Uncharacterized protein n=1 Tax=Herbaspirillum chlorophenolicum TaxID=211589 RepID=A0ABW8EV33_9BURK